MPSSGAGPADPEVSYKVVYNKVAVRDKPSTRGRVVQVARSGDVVSGVPSEFDGQPWLRFSKQTCDKFELLTDTAWILIDGSHLGLGSLLRPHAQVDCLEELLWRLGGDCGGNRIRPVIGAIHKANLKTGSDFLAATETTTSQENLQKQICSETQTLECPLPPCFVNCVRIAVEDSRLAFSGYPLPPPHTKCRILFTAPHSLALCREGHRPHVPEAYTSRLARHFADDLGGAFLTWTQKEERRANDHFKSNGVPDPTNKDPNFTPRSDLTSSPWTRNLREIEGLWPPNRPCLHVDLHGCKDPGPSGGSHLVVGLGAMEREVHERAEHFRNALHKTFAAALRGISINVRPQTQLTGALENNRCTLTQQSLSEEGGGWTWSVQLEMSRTLRKLLIKKKEVRILMAQAILFAWTIASQDVPEPHQTSHVLQYWFARCKALYSRRETLLSEVEEAPSRNASCGVAAATEAELSDVEDEEDGVGEATANSEARPPPCRDSPSQIESELKSTVKALPGFSVEDWSQNTELATRVTLLRDWLDSSSDVIPWPPLPQHEYSIAGTWSAHRPVSMHWDGSRFVHSLMIGKAGWERFQILQDADWQRTIYPSVVDASPLVKHTLLGPDAGGHGMNWLIGGSPSIVKTGECYQVIISVDSNASVKKVMWERLEARDLEIIVHVDREMDIKVVVEMTQGATVYSVKEKLAADDPTGRTQPKDIILKACGIGTGSTPLDDATMIATYLTELEISPTGGDID